MRFSLGTLLLTTLLLSSLVAVWMLRNPWYLIEVKSTKEFDLRSYGIVSPDRTRMVNRKPWNNLNTEWIVIYENGDYAVQMGILAKIDVKSSHYAARFIDNDTIGIYLEYEADILQENIYRRRHPEWWWGHFYRPEVWALSGLTLMIAWRGVKRFRSFRATP